jgi:hypothetical protein
VRVAGLAVLAWNPGCENAVVEQTEPVDQSYIWYCDGAGGGGVFANWAGGVRQGLQDAGYGGAGEIYRWNTGLGVVADQNASVAYKRSKATALARQIHAYAGDHPDAATTLMGLSAGTAIVVFALEEMDRGETVENAFLLSSSVNSTYDLTRALRHVADRMYVFTSANDGVLRHLVPLSGTADRASGSIPAAGLRGFRTPAGASSDTREQYAKLVHIRWRPEFARRGHQGGHTDVVNAQFVRDYIAPLVIKSSKPKAAVASRPAGKVQNPDYQRWARFGIGSTITWQGHQTIGGDREPMKVTATLVSKHPDRVVVERSYWPMGQRKHLAPRVQSFIETAWIDPTDHPRTHPACTLTNLPGKTVKIAGKTIHCDVQQADVDAEFDDWGRDLEATLYRSDTIPGGLVKLAVKSHMGEQPFEFYGEMVDYKIVPDRTRQ